MPFAFHRQPFKSVYLLVGTIYIFIRLPVWTARNFIPAWRARKGWSITRSLVMELINAATSIMLQTGLPSPEPLEKLALSAAKTGFVWVEPTPDLIVGDIQRFAQLNEVSALRIGGFWYGARGPGDVVGQRADPREKVIYHLHGGGFVMGSGSPAFLPTAATIEGILEHVPQFSRVYALEYRLASGAPFPTCNPFPTALIDAIAGYDYLIRQIGFSPDNIIVSGDSAGGVLAYQLARHIDAANLATLPQPGALLLLSPSADSGWRTPPGGSMQTNRRSDYVRTWFDAGYVPPTLLGALPVGELDQPWLSPGSPVLSNAETAGLFKGFPQTFILAGEAEMSRDSMRTLRDRMRADMGESQVQYAEIAGAPHDFTGMTILEPERTMGLKAIGKWVCDL
ncbi:alpha/beta-hydrolase [Mycena maculata]|uniref:Alpha/beta-hydrolase n=1 Tax=Mycena maculata TaxID=230809 RepID=A0AAD7N7U4_9AGAR|nr:alpha/beta-hydrolase [Mycena maculata]